MAIRAKSLILALATNEFQIFHFQKYVMLALISGKNRLKLKELFRIEHFDKEFELQLF
jgi:hypothetical protein